MNILRYLDPFSWFLFQLALFKFTVYSKCLHEVRYYIFNIYVISIIKKLNFILRIACVESLKWCLNTLACRWVIVTSDYTLNWMKHIGMRNTEQVKIYWIWINNLRVWVIWGIITVIFFCGKTKSTKSLGEFRKY